ncbi:MAG: hypothetical protein IT381_10175 [Deltaproteobacteria bacterium]|nr:hypothetical protein [Deltaproteobacteria bacterium]
MRPDEPPATPDNLELLRRYLLSGRSRSAPLTLLPAQLVPLASQEAFIAIGDEAFAAWTLAANLQAPCLVAVTQKRAAYFDHLVILGLFSITGGPQDFYARLTSRADASPAAVPASEPSVALLRDTAHHVCRAVSEQLGHRLAEAERAIVFERMWRLAFSPPPAPGFLRDERTYAALERLTRSGFVELIWGDGRTYIAADQANRALRSRGMAIGAFAVFDPRAEFDHHAARAPWERVPWSDTARAFLTSATDQRQCDREGLFAALPSDPPSAAAAASGDDPLVVERALANVFRDDSLFLELLDEALAGPYPPLLGTLFRHLGDYQRRGDHAIELGAHPLGPLLALCDSQALHDDDPTWRELCESLVEIPAPLRERAVNALSQRLGLFE